MPCSFILPHRGYENMRGRSGDLPLGSKEFREKTKHVALCGGIDSAHPFDQPLFVHCADLIEHDLTGFAFESHRDAGGVGAAFRARMRLGASGVGG